MKSSNWKIFGKKENYQYSNGSTIASHGDYCILSGKYSVGHVVSWASSVESISLITRSYKQLMDVSSSFLKKQRE